MNTTASLPEVRLKRGKEESLLRFHPWVFSGAVASMPEGLEEGTLVRVTSAGGQTLGTGHWQIGSIAVRILEFGETVPGADFYTRRLTEAYRMRESLGLLRPDNDCVRLVHGEGDFLPGLVVDLYGPTAVMQAHSVGMHRERAAIAQALTELPGVGAVYYKSDTTLPFKAGLDPVNGYLLGNESEAVAVENGLRFNIDWLRGQKTGFFLDQRENRALLERYARGRDVLNMFCYTGGFSVYAMRGGARRVVSVDSSAKAIALTRANMELNFPDDPRHSAVAEDAFKYLAEMPDGAFDLIVLDPPAFAKHRGALKNGLLGYRKLNARAFDKIRPGGILFTFSCSQVVSKDAFRAAVFTAAAQSGRRVRILHQLTQGPDHPVSIYHPEGEYLKGLVLQVE